MRSLPLTLLVALCVGSLQAEPREVALEPYASFKSPQINESSGLVKSRTRPGAYWTHNDSGDAPRLFMIDREGHLLGNSASDAPQHHTLVGARNIDWEDIAADNDGNLYIGAFGNNGNARRDLSIYMLREPTGSDAHVTEQWRFAYPDQTAFPPPPKERNFDCEALVWANGEIYLLTKHRGDTNTKLYRLETRHPSRLNTLKLLGDFPVRGMVTAADASPDGEQLAVLTYNSVWLFEKPQDDDNYLAGPAARLPIQAGQCEAICFDGPDTLIITSEQGNLYSVAIDHITRP